MRETFRVFSLTETYDIWTPSESEVYFYNLFFAFISIIFGQSLCFSLWFDKPKRLFQNLHKRNTVIVNSQRALNSYFLSWFSKIVIVCFIFFGTIIQGGYSYLDFYPDYIWVFVLLIIFLFFQSWNSILLQYKRKSFWWLLLSIFVVISLSFGLSKVNVIDYHKINDIAKSKNTLSNYTLNLPKSENYSKLEKISLVKRIYIVQNNNGSAEKKPLIIIDNKIVSFEELYSIITEWKSQKEEAEIPFMTYLFHIDTEINMEFFYKLKSVFHSWEGSKFSFAVDPKNRNSENIQSSNLAIHIYMLNFKIIEPDDLQSITQQTDSIKNKIDVSVTESNNFIVNGALINETKLSNYFYNLITNETDYIVRIYLQESDNFGSYFSIIEATKTAIKKLRNEYALQTYNEQYESLDNDKMKEIRELYPQMIINMADLPIKN